MPFASGLPVFFFGSSSSLLLSLSNSNPPGGAPEVPAPAAPADAPPKPASWKKRLNSSKKLPDAWSCSNGSEEVVNWLGLERRSASYSALRFGSERT